MTEIKLNIPYHSQFLEVEDYFWNIRSCGGACLKMCLDYYNKNSPSIVEIMNNAKQNGGYDMKNGFVHDWAVNYLKSFDLKSYRKEGLEDMTLIKESLEKGNPIIVSVTKRTLEQNKFHLILIVGCVVGVDGQIVEVIYHEPERTNKDDGAFRRCDMQTFSDSWRKKAIFVEGLN